MQTTLKTYPALDKLRFVSRPPFFWTEAAARLDKARNALVFLFEFDDPEIRENALNKGLFPKQQTDDPNAPAKQLPVEEIEAFREAVESWRLAQLSLCLEANGLKLDAESGTPLFGSCLVERTSVINLAKQYSNVLPLPIFTESIARAAKDNDRSFFIRLGEALKASNARPAMDWNRCHKLDCFLVDFWCGLPSSVSSLPPLCFFTDNALAIVCSYVVEDDPGDRASKEAQTSEDAVSHRRKRLRLRQARSPKIRGVWRTENSILLTEQATR